MVLLKEVLRRGRERYLGVVSWLRMDEYVSLPAV